MPEYIVTFSDAQKFSVTLPDQHALAYRLTTLTEEVGKVVNKETKEVRYYLGTRQLDAVHDMKLIHSFDAALRQNEAHALDAWFSQLVRTAVILRDSDLDWETKFDIIFGDHVMGRISRGLEIEWDDPDGTFEEDVNAYVAALEKKLIDLT